MDTCCSIWLSHIARIQTYYWVGDCGGAHLVITFSNCLSTAERKSNQLPEIENQKPSINVNIACEGKQNNSKNRGEPQHSCIVLM